MENIEEAEALLSEKLGDLKKVPYERLSTLMGAANVEALEVDAPSGMGYDVEVESVWAGEPGGKIIINIAVFERSMAVVMPLTASFVMAPDGTIVEDSMEGGPDDTTEPDKDKGPGKGNC